MVFEQVAYMHDHLSSLGHNCPAHLCAYLGWVAVALHDAMLEDALGLGVCVYRRGLVLLGLLQLWRQRDEGEAGHNKAGDQKRLAGAL